MKKILLSVMALAIMSSFAYADNGKKPSAKKKAKVANCKRSNCSATSKCNQGTCPDMPGCICH